MIARTPPPPYYAVIFTSMKNADDTGYADMAEQMEALAKTQPGYLGFESARSGLGISVSYWESPEAIVNWKKNAEHRLAQKAGREKWYADFKVRVCKVERDYSL